MRTHRTYGWMGSDGKSALRRRMETPLCAGSHKLRRGDSKSALRRRGKEAVGNWGNREIDGGRRELRET